MSLASSNAANESKFWSEDEPEEELVEHPRPIEIKQIIQRFEQV